jgi:hypothetical protein
VLDNGNNYCATIVHKVVDRYAKNHQAIKFLVKLGDCDYDEIMSYNELAILVEDHQSAPANLPDTSFTFKSIIDHQDIHQPNHIDYEGSSLSLLVQWKDDSKIFEPLDILIKDVPITITKYDSNNYLLGTPGWKWLKHIATNQHCLSHMVHQAKVSYPLKGHVYKFGVHAPCTVKQALDFDKTNGSALW